MATGGQNGPKRGENGLKVVKATKATKKRPKAAKKEWPVSSKVAEYIKQWPKR